MEEEAKYSKEVKYILDIFWRCTLNPDKKERKEVIEEFWSLVLFERWDNAITKLNKWNESLYGIGCRWAKFNG